MEVLRWRGGARRVKRRASATKRERNVSKPAGSLPTWPDLKYVKRQR